MLRAIFGVVLTPLRMLLPSKPHLLPVSDEPAPNDGVQELRDELLTMTIRAQEAETAKLVAVSRWKSADAGYEGALIQIRALAQRLAVYEPDEDDGGDGLPVAGLTVRVP